MSKMFRKRDTLIENMTLMALMAALCAICVLISFFFPFGSIFVILFLPLSTTIVILSCKKKYLPIYFAATITVCIISSGFQFSETILYVIPALAMGLTYGLLLEKKVPTFISLIVIALVGLIFSYLSIAFINVLIDGDMIELLLSIFKIQKNNIKEFIPALIFLYNLAQALIVHCFIITVGETLQIKTIQNDEVLQGFPFVSFIFSILAIIFSFILIEVFYILFIISIYFAGFSIYLLFKNRKTFSFITLAILSLLAFFSIPLLMPFVSEGKEIVLFISFSFAFSIAGMTNAIYTIKEKKFKEGKE